MTSEQNSPFLLSDLVQKNIYCNSNKIQAFETIIYESKMVYLFIRKLSSENIF